MFLTTPVAHITDNVYNLYFLADDSIWKLTATSVQAALDGQYHVSKLLSITGSIKNLAISDDGLLLSFACTLEGMYDVYVVSTMGGNPQRITNLAARYIDVMEFIESKNKIGLENTKNYTVTFTSMHESIALELMIYTVDLKMNTHTFECTSSPQEKLFNTHVSWYSTNKDVDVIQTHGYGYAKWRKYNGGDYGQLWIRHKENHILSSKKAFHKLVDTGWNAIRPCIKYGKVYFLSDIDGVGNIYISDIDIKTTTVDKPTYEQITHSKDFYIEQFSVTSMYTDSADILVHYAAGGCLYVHSIKNNKTHKLHLNLSAYTPHLYNRLLLDSGEYKSSMIDSMQDYIISNDGKRLAFVIRGKVFEMTTYNSVAWPVAQSIPANIQLIKIDTNGNTEILQLNGTIDNPVYSHALYLHNKMLLVELATPEHPQRLVLLDTEAHNRNVLSVIEYDFGYITNITPSARCDKLAITNNRAQLLLLSMEYHKEESDKDNISNNTDTINEMQTADDTSKNIQNKNGIKSAKIKELIASRYYTTHSVDWSPHGRYLAYSQNLNSTLYTTTICIYDTQTDTVHHVTNNHYYDTSPRFDLNGKYLYFLSNRNAKPTYDNLRTLLTYSDLYHPYVILLQENVADPFLHLEDDSACADENAGKTTTAVSEESAHTDEVTETQGDAEDVDEACSISFDILESTEAVKDICETIAQEQTKLNHDANIAADPDTKTNKVDLAIDFAEIQSRILICPNTHADYLHLDVQGKDILLYTYNDDHIGFDVQKYSIEAQKTTDFLTNINDLTLSQDKSKFVYITSRTVKIGGITQSDHAWKKAGVIEWSRIHMFLKPLDEFKVLFTQAWFIAKETYYYVSQKNINWEYLYEKYHALVMKVTSREELNHVILLMQGELETSHSYVYQTGDTRKTQQQSQGYLGAQLSYIHKDKCKDHQSGYKIDYIYPNDSWSDNPLMQVPLAGCKIGDVITHINEQELTDILTPALALRNLAHKIVRIKIAREDRLEKGIMKQLIKYIKPIASEKNLIYKDWINKNLDQVTKASAELGYIHIPGMDDEGFDQFVKSFFAQYRTKGLIIDLRYNTGGYTHPMILDMLMRKQIGMTYTKYGEEMEPYEAYNGKLVFLINGATASDGDVCAYAVKKHKLGKLIGVRTWGGVVGIMPRYTLLDGGKFAHPEFAISLLLHSLHNSAENSTHVTSKSLAHKTQVENHGVDPDIYVENVPNSDEDSQLMSGIEELLKLI